MFVNLCRHAVTVGGVVVEPSGTEARVDTVAVQTREVMGVPVQVKSWGEVVGLPAPVAGTWFLVSGVVLSALKEQGCRRSDVLAPATSPKDNVLRDSNGQVSGVTRLDGLV